MSYCFQLHMVAAAPPLDSIRQQQISALDCSAPSKSKQIKWSVPCWSGRTMEWRMSNDFDGNDDDNSKKNDPNEWHRMLQYKSIFLFQFLSVDCRGSDRQVFCDSRIVRVGNNNKTDRWSYWNETADNDVDGTAEQNKNIESFFSARQFRS